MTRFSIIIPLYNKELSVRATIESVLKQTYPHFELIIVNDGSTDGSLEMARQFTDTRITIIDVPNGGVSNARNIGIYNAKCEYITFLDADDLWYENSLAEFKLLIDSFKKAQVFCTSHTLTIKSIPSREKRYYVDNFWKKNAESYARSTTALVCTGCISIKKDCFKTVTGFNSLLTHGEDLDLWNRLAENFIFAKSEIVTMLYRLNAENRSDKSIKIEKDRIAFVSREEVADKLKALDYGRIYFFELYYNLKALKNFKLSFKLLLNYGDWIFSFILLLIKVKTSKK
jgi:glycosyltransferase involved in cell wall biosynthesis